MTRKLSRTLVLCALLLGPGRLAAQNGPDNDADAAPGYTNSVFHHEEIDSINLYNGQLTLPSLSARPTPSARSCACSYP